MLEAKPQVPKGQFEDWVKRNFDISLRQGQYYMKLAAVENERVDTRSFSTEQMWTIQRSAHCEFNSGLFRGALAAASGTFAGNLISDDLEIGSGTAVASALFQGTAQNIIGTENGPLAVSATGGSLTLSTINENITIDPGSAALFVGASGAGTVRIRGNTLGFYGSIGGSRPVVTGSGDARLTSLLPALAGLGLIDDQTT